MNAYKEKTKNYHASYTEALRANRKLTQENMAEQLRISCRAYGDLERGKYCFSSIALLFMLGMKTMNMRLRGMEKPSMWMWTLPMMMMP